MIKCIKRKGLMTFMTAMVICAVMSCSTTEKRDREQGIPAYVVMSKQILQDKIKGGWAGKTIGCTYNDPGLRADHLER
jgi:hypothetical protein